MIWLWIIPATLLGLIVLFAIAGAMLPKGHTATRSAVFKSAPATVYAALRNMQEATSWRPDMKSVERLPDRNGHEVWKEIARQGPMITELIEDIPNQKLVRKIVDNRAFGGTWIYQITPEGEGCRLTLTENGEIYNPVFRFMAKFFFSMTGTMEKYLIALAGHLSEGNDVLDEKG